MRSRRNRYVVIVYPALVAACASSTRLMTFAEYRETSHPVPYILRGASGRGQLLYYGAAHVYDADHPTIADIQRRWDSFMPTYALNEGGTPPVYETVAETVGRNG
jgi:hypothetical protein